MKVYVIMSVKKKTGKKEVIEVHKIENFAIEMKKKMSQFKDCMNYLKIRKYIVEEHNFYED